jgi:hypothetical protein
MLGVRPGIDVRPDAHGQVHPGGGMSVTPEDPKRLPLHLRPEALGGLGRLPVFHIDVGILGGCLKYVPSARKPTHHGQIEPAAPVPLATFQNELCATSGSWTEWEQAA